MIEEYIRKYIIVLEVFNENRDSSLSVNEIYKEAETKAVNYNLHFTDKDVKNILTSLYDEFTIDKVISENNIVCFKIANKYKTRRIIK